MESNLAHSNTKKALVSLRKLSEIVKDLPDPETCHERSVERKCGALMLKFEKIIYRNSEGKHEQRWSYNARIVV